MVSSSQPGNDQHLGHVEEAKAGIPAGVGPAQRRALELIALRLFSRGELLPALIALGGAGWWYWFRRGGALPGSRGAMSRAEASRLLDVSPSASPEEVRAAHRRLVARVHPDAGGSADLAAQVNAARDALLRR